MRRNLPSRVPDVELPPFICSCCYFYDPVAIDHGACYALPPPVVYDADGDLTCPRSIVLADDKGCIYFKGRHTA